MEQVPLGLKHLVLQRSSRQKVNNLKYFQKFPETDQNHKAPGSLGKQEVAENHYATCQTETRQGA